MDCCKKHFDMPSAVALALSILSFLPGAHQTLAQQGSVPDLYASRADNSSDRFWSVDWSPDGTKIAIGGTQGIDLYDTKSMIVSPLEHTKGSISPITWSPNSSKLAGVQQDEHGIFIWNANGELLGTLQGDTYIWSIAWSMDNRVLAIGEWKRIELWDTESFEQIKEMSTGDSDVFGLSWNPDGHRLMAVLTLEGGVVIWDTRSGTTVAHVRPDRAMQSAAWSPDGTKIATVGSETSSRTNDCPTCVTFDPQIWADNGTLWKTLHGHSDFVIVVKWSPDGKHIVTGDREGEMILWEASTGRRLATSHIHLGSFNELVDENSIDWRPDGKYLALVNDAGHFQIWDAFMQKMSVDLEPTHPAAPATAEHTP